MTAQPLSRYFEDAGQQRLALDSLDHWFVSNELRIYEWSKRAFDANSTDAPRNFQNIYDELAGHWQVFRPHNPSACWSAETIHRTLTKEFATYAWSEPITLLTFSLAEHGVDLRQRLAKMRAIKPNTSYPHMAVSKVLHFFNPALFPIYDTVMIWDRVFKAFKVDFREFVEGAGISYRSAMGDDEMFLLSYISRASSLMSSAHPTFMTVFRDFTRSKTPGEISIEPTTLCARAFEYTALGAAERELKRRAR